MSLKNCLLFEFAKNTREFSEGWGKEKQLQDTLKEILDNSKLAFIHQLGKKLLISGISLSNKVFLNSSYLPASINPLDQEKGIHNLVILNTEIAGLNLSDSLLEASLICGSNESELQSQSISLNNSDLNDVVFAFNNLKGISCRRTTFHDVLIRNCPIEYAVFSNYRIEHSLVICYDSDSKNGDNPHFTNSVFFNSSPQQNENYEFIFSNVILDNCLFLGFFQPTQLIDTEFNNCTFGNREENQTGINKSTIIGRKTKKLFQENKWIIKHSEFVNCTMKQIHTSIEISDNSRVTCLILEECEIPHLIIDSSSLLETTSVKIKNSRITNLEIKSETSLKTSIEFCLNDKGSTLTNPKLQGVTIKGNLETLSIETTAKSSSLNNCNILGRILKANFILSDTKTNHRLDLTGTHFLGMPEEPMILENVNFSKCIFNKTKFKDCNLINCTFPKKAPTSKNRASFENCIIINDSIENADLSNVKICSNSTLSANKINNTSFG